MTEVIKPCVKCGAQERNKRGGCKPCKRESDRKYRESNPEKVAEAGRKWAEANREKRTASSRKWQKANPERQGGYERKYREVNPEKTAEARHNWREANPDYARNWREANPEKTTVYSHSRRAKVKGNGGKLSKDIAQSLMTLQKGKCACGCGASLKKTGYHLDHIMPIALGGKNTDDNIQLLTPKCNRRKSAKHPDDWARDIGRLI